MSWKGSLDTVHPIQSDLLPERDMPEFLIDGVRGPLNHSMSEVAWKAFKDVGRRRCRAFADEGLL
jgi:hypothetical protein